MKLRPTIGVLWVAAWIPWGAYFPAHRMQLKDGQILEARFSKSCNDAKITSPGEKGLKLVVARTEPFQRRGLGHRKRHMNSDEGMLFVFDPPRMGQIWMKDTWIPLQLVHVVPSGGVVSVQEMPVEKDPTQPTQIYSAQPLVNAVVELKPGRIPSPGFDLQLCLKNR